MTDRITGVEIRSRSLTPAEAEVWVTVHAGAATPATEVRGRLMGPSCPYSSTVEVAYPLRPLAHPPADFPPLTMRVVIPEPSLWEPESPFLYRGPVELWQDGRRVDRATVRHGLCSSALTPRGLQWNGKPLPLRGRAVRGLTDDIALSLRRDGFNLLLAPLEEPQAWEVADRLGFVVIGQAAALDDDAVSQMRRLAGHPSTLGYLFDNPPMRPLPPDGFPIGFRGAVTPGVAFLSCPAGRAAFAPTDIPVLVFGETATASPVMGCVL
jgi:hypothetical protein